VLIALAMELAGVAALPFAVGMYLPLSTTTPIFVGGMLRLVADRLRGASASEAEADTSPGVLLASGYIAGGTLIGLVLAFLAFPALAAVNDAINLGKHFGPSYNLEESVAPKVVALLAFAALAVILFRVGLMKSQVTEPDVPPASPDGGPTPTM
jgi:hypothetical protein